jgi:hypothetical protein
MHLIETRLTGYKVGTPRTVKGDAQPRRLFAIRRPSKSGRQDLNLRPPGPQPEESGYVGRDSALYSDVGASELLSVALALDPGLHP